MFKPSTCPENRNRYSRYVIVQVFPRAMRAKPHRDQLTTHMTAPNLNWIANYTWGIAPALPTLFPTCQDHPAGRALELRAWRRVSEMPSFGATSLP